MDQSDHGEELVMIIICIIINNVNYYIIPIIIPDSEQQ